MRRVLVCAGVLLAGVLVSGAVLAQSMGERMASLGVVSPPVDPSYGPLFDQPGLQCVQARALSGVVASNDREVIFRFGAANFYRLRLNKACPALLEPGAQVVDIKRGSDIICGPGDVELKVAVADGPVSRCTVGSLSRMSTAEVKTASGPAG